MVSTIIALWLSRHSLLDITAFLLAISKEVYTLNRMPMCLVTAYAVGTIETVHDELPHVLS